MKTRYFVATVFGGIILLLVFLLAGGQTKSDEEKLFEERILATAPSIVETIMALDPPIGIPTAAPPFKTPPTAIPTPGPNYVPPPYPTTPALDHEVTKSEAVDLALYFDRLAQWQEPWSLKTIEKDTERITVALHPSRAAADKAIGYDIVYDPELEEEAGRVWAISVKGLVNLFLMMPGGPDEYTDSVVYQISARTGNLVGVHTGPPVK